MAENIMLVGGAGTDLEPGRANQGQYRVMNSFVGKTAGRRLAFSAQEARKSTRRAPEYQ